MLVAWLRSSLALALLLISQAGASAFDTVACTHRLYCNETLLAAVVLHGGIYDDSKYFVDQPTRIPLADLLRQLTDEQTLRNVTRLASVLTEGLLPAGAELESYTPEDHFPVVAEEVSPSDGNGTLPSISMWTTWLHTQWRLLTRRINNTAVCVQGCTTSALQLPRPFVVPGGRFVESYYWDTYWITKGLLVSRMLDTVYGLLENMRWTVMEYGFIPNGNRVYYLNRSQPPVFAWMLMDYVQAALQHPPLNDSALLDQIALFLPALHREYVFWMLRRAVDLPIAPGSGDPVGQLNRFIVAENRQPRPESFAEDFLRAQSINGTDAQAAFYASTAAGAESGWDFSSRWFKNGDSKNGGSAFDQLGSIYTENVLPVDLNSLLHGYEIILATLHGAVLCAQTLPDALNLQECLLNARRHAFQPQQKTDFMPADLARAKQLHVRFTEAGPGDELHVKHAELVQHFTVQAQLRRRLVRAYFWDAECRLFVDFYLDSQSHRACNDANNNNTAVYASSLFPYWARVVDVKGQQTDEDSLPPVDVAVTSDGIAVEDLLAGMARLNQTFLSPFPGGVPTSLLQSGQQWDFPNAWSPLQWVAVEALQFAWMLERWQGTALAEERWTEVAVSLISRWLRSGYCGWWRHQSDDELHNGINTAVKNQTTSVHQKFWQGTLTGPEYLEHIRVNVYVPRLSRRSLSGNESTAAGSRMGGMFEKYDVRLVGYPGGGGEYIVQDGFGWTNGVVLDFLSRFGGYSFQRLASRKQLRYRQTTGDLAWLDGAEWRDDVADLLRPWLETGQMQQCANEGLGKTGTESSSSSSNKGYTSRALLVLGLVLMASMAAVVVFGVMYVMVRAKIGSRIEYNDELQPLDSRTIHNRPVRRNGTRTLTSPPVGEGDDPNSFAMSTVRWKMPGKGYRPL